MRYDPEFVIRGLHIDINKVQNIITVGCSIVLWRVSTKTPENY